MSERRKAYPFDRFESKWQRLWDERQLFHVPNPGEAGFDSTKPKFYILDMFPYPSGAGLHVGHPEGYTATDIIARYKRMRGFNVLHPMGWDAFGLPAEQYAIKSGQHPAVTTRENVAKFKSQLKRIGFSYDWQEEIKVPQQNWIGRSEGAEVDFKIDSQKIRVFTTRPDTLYGATYMVLAPEHSVVDLVVTEEQWPAVREYRAKTARKSDLERTELAKEKTGVFTGAFAINPVNDEKIPIWIADYVLLGYGTGAIMAVPAHDERDLEFARKFDLPIRQVVQPPAEEEPIGFIGDGVAINSPIIDGLPSREAIRKITEWLEARGLGKRAINYKLRDWLFSRQGYGGEPFPMIWASERDGQHRHHQALDESELPVVPPPLEDYKPTGTGEPPLAKAKDWVRYSKKAARETNVMPQWAGSCWYYLRFCDPQNDKRLVGEKPEKYWMGGDNPGGVDLYVGGTEHAVLHLLYARFWHKVLFDLSYVSKPEPFQRLVNQGIILGEDNQKMSKSRGNIVNPDDVIEQYGADAFRCYEMFMGPLEQMKPWSMRGVEGVARFLARVWRLMMSENQAGKWELSSAVQDVDLTKAQQKILHATIKKVTGDIESLSFNTAISQMMIFVNAFTTAESIPLSAMQTFLILLNPFAPHLSSELWEIVKLPGPMTEKPGPGYDERFLVEDEVEIVIQVNGKVRDRMNMSIQASKEELKAAALANPKIQQLIAGKIVQKTVIVPKKLVNIVV